MEIIFPNLVLLPGMPRLSDEELLPITGLHLQSLEIGFWNIHSLLGGPGWRDIYPQSNWDEFVWDNVASEEDEGAEVKVQTLILDHGRHDWEAPHWPWPCIRFEDRSRWRRICGKEPKAEMVAHRYWVHRPDLARGRGEPQLDWSKGEIKWTGKFFWRRKEDGPPPSFED